MEKRTKLGMPRLLTAEKSVLQSRSTRQEPNCFVWWLAIIFIISAWKNIHLWRVTVLKVKAKIKINAFFSGEVQCTEAQNDHISYLQDFKKTTTWDFFFFSFFYFRYISSKLKAGPNKQPKNYALQSLSIVFFFWLVSVNTLKYNLLRSKEQVKSFFLYTIFWNFVTSVWPNN